MLTEPPRSRAGRTGVWSVGPSSLSGGKVQSSSRAHLNRSTRTSSVSPAGGTGSSWAPDVPHEHLSQASPDLLRERINQRNSYRYRDLDTRIETLDVAIPKLREGSYWFGGPEWSELHALDAVPPLNRGITIDDRFRYLVKRLVVSAGEPTQPVKGRVDADLMLVRQHALGLFDDDP
jgi:hypothetical protein